MQTGMTFFTIGHGHRC